MSEPSHAELMFSKALGDFKALPAMQNPGSFTDEIFGFHAQQAVEKSLKAWLSLLGDEYPRTHDIRELLRLISNHGIDVDNYRDLMELNIYAVQFRYITGESPDIPLDRPGTIEQIRPLIEYLGSLI